MRSQLIAHTLGGEDFDIELLRPEGEGEHPCVLVFHAWKGRGEHEQQRARRLAELGFVAAGVDLYGVGKRGHDTDSARELMMGLLSDPPKLRARIQASFETVRALESVDASRMGAIGFCFGGLCVQIAARMGLDLRGVVSFHGLLKVGQPLETRPKAKLMIQHGQDDPMVPPEDLSAFAAEMKRIDADWVLHAYPGVQHAFTNPAAADTAGGLIYDADADARSWLEMRRFFEDCFA